MMNAISIYSEQYLKKKKKKNPSWLLLKQCGYHNDHLVKAGGIEEL